MLVERKMLQICLAALLFSFSAIGVNAQEPSTPTQSISPEKRVLIKELLELTSSKKTIDAMFKAQAEQMDKDLPETAWRTVSELKAIKSLPPKEREELRLKVIESSRRSGLRMYELMQEKLDFSKLMEEIFMPLHDKYFTESELKDLVAFYKSGTGKKVIDVMPELLTAAMKQTIDAILPKVMEIETQVQQEETARMEQEAKAIVETNPPNRATRTPTKRRRH